MSRTRVYRAVSIAEWQDIRAIGKLRPGPNSVEGKWFADSAAGAIAHGQALFGRSEFRIVEVDVPDDVPSLFQHPNLDGFGPARFVHADDLDKLTLHFVK
jgi:hypothetical protein